jgi:1-aminocyclopropane-1-carboxylate deaminase/D-cysteine desulfhydrase-like pyridoxal-dependent ACC family enzyme
MTPYPFETIQNAIDQLPRLALNERPTPLHFCPNLTKELGGPRIFIKRDDLTGHAFGGNKSRYLEFTMGQAVDQGADAVLLSAVVQSNHCRQFAAAAARHGLKAVVVLRPNDSLMGRQVPATGNYLLDQLYGAKVRIAPSERLSEVISEELDTLRQAGYSPLQVPGQRSSVAYIECALELERQCATQQVKPDHIYIASGGTSLSGLVAGFTLLGHAPHFVGTPQSKLGGTPAEAVQAVARRATDAAAMIGLSCTPEPQRIRVIDDYVGDYFGHLTDPALAAIRLLARTEAILVDPAYTGKAFACLLDSVNQGEIPADEDIIFVHTGGTPLIFVYGDELLA